MDENQPFAPIMPNAPFCAVGDIHGRADLLEGMLARIAPLLDYHTVFVGDMVDRGPQSAAVLRRVHALTEQSPDQFTALMGNHEALLLAFLDSPETVGADWFRFGGLQTLASFGVSISGSVRSLDVIIEARDALRASMGPALVAWLAARPRSWNSGNMHVVHAGADPCVSMTEQADDHLIWGHRDFALRSRGDEQWVIHGHTIVDYPVQYGGRVAIDTGAYATGRLAGAQVCEGEIDLFEVIV
ncbi:metallophosphoesterase (plasmid) [Falsihalocynthiibacter sp. SS001]|uniref:metallophosphoesterase n=1 Tax=Falsihalocynthiibacter sp. SS001 TaxID=3349698 RepID=UPI0036D2297C